MKAVVLNGYGDLDQLEVVDVDQPVPGDDQVLVQVKAASINPMDWKIVHGALEGKITFPFRIGIDMAGVVTAVGSSATDFAEGDEVYGSAMVLAGGSGAFAEYATVTPNTIAKKPRVVNMNEAAGLGLTGVSALQALTEHLKLEKGQKLLITGGAGGIGSMAIAMAKSLGATVAVTVRNAEDAAYAKSRGADVVVDVSHETLGDVVKDYDAVFDLVGGDARADAMRTLKKGGTVVSMVGTDDVLAAELGVTAIGQGTKEDREHLVKLAEWTDETTTRPHITVFPLTQVREAFDAAERGRIQGKAVLEISK